MILNIAFNKLNLAMLYCNCLSTNPNVIKFNKLLGFTEENIIKNKYIIDEVNVDMHYLTLYKGNYNGNIIG